MVPEYNLKHHTWDEAMKLGAEKTYIQPKLGHEDIAFLQYTGGTTGVSKGAVLTHKNIIANMLQIFEWMSPAITTTAPPLLMKSRSAGIPVAKASLAIAPAPMRIVE